jgi:hypothetical protein
MGQPLHLVAKANGDKSMAAKREQPTRTGERPARPERHGESYTA